MLSRCSCLSLYHADLCLDKLYFFFWRVQLKKRYFEISHCYPYNQLFLLSWNSWFSKIIKWINIRNKTPQNTHTHTHTHTHRHRHTLTHTLTLPPSHTHTHTHTLLRFYITSLYIKSLPHFHGLLYRFNYKFLPVVGRNFFQYWYIFKYISIEKSKTEFSDTSIQQPVQIFGRLEAKGSNCVCKWLVVKPFYLILFHNVPKT